ncbi:hypothetical protein [Streptacidiphilus sp. MAP5-3]|uniref:hypothetical protein n=1 Tax=unclassified Streptacidiphilus TaxID=2643834 RepID=UPI0035142733
MSTSSRRGARLAKAAVVGAVLAATTLGVAGTASANGLVTWTNKATGDSLAYGTNCGCVYTGAGEDNTPYGEWYDYQQPNGTWIEANDGEGGNWCLDSNTQWDNGQQGNVYLTSCNPPTPTNTYQHWYEISTSNGWALRSQQTGLYLDGGSGPANTGVYTNGAYGLGNNYQHWS